MTAAQVDRTWLVAYAVGPVQDFVATARKMRDLWAGSELLSQLAAAALGAALRHGGNGVFPASRSAGSARLAAASLPNRGVIVWRGSDPAHLAEEMQRAVHRRLHRLAESVKRKFRADRQGIGSAAFDAARYEQQLSDLIEFYCAWAPCEDVDDPDCYRAAYADLQRELIARKRTRWFAPAAYGAGGVAKSALDAARESVLSHAYVSADTAERRWHQRLFAIEGEALDAPALIKRVLGGQRPFQAISRIVLGPWLKTVQCEANGPALLKGLERAYGDAELSTAGLASRSAPRDLLPYDGQLLFEGRIKREMNGLPTDDAAQGALMALKDTLHDCEAAVPIPAPNIALLALDIDRFGTRLWKSDLKGQKALAALAADFTNDVQRLVADHLGVVLYAGGDEALVVLPVPEALDCAVAIGRCFGQRVACSGLSGEPATLSAGLAVGHILTPLSRLRGWALDALNAAKQGLTPRDRPRNALVVTVKPRSGGVLRARGGWESPGTDARAALGHRLAQWIEAYRSGILPAGAPYEVARLLQAGAGDHRLELAHLTRFAGRRPRGTDAPWFVEATACLRPKPGTGALLDTEALVQELLLARWMDRYARVPVPRPAAAAPASAVVEDGLVESS